ncbi:MAG TPA: hypothetical protein ENO22_13215 [candidate division Zixibacteria bacterium]|nr:hypothetical protein [candidate division Zixibacteria bacterium]
MKTPKLASALLTTILAVCFAACSEDSSSSEEQVLHPECTKADPGRTDMHTPQSMVADWGDPVRLDETINTNCPEDAIEISADGRYLYFMFTTDLLEKLTPGEILARENNTYRAERIGGPGEFAQPVFFDLGKGTLGSLDGELSFSPDGSKVYFHSNRPENTGYNHTPYYDDFLDIYVAEITDGEAGPAENLGPPVNSVYPDGEHALYPDGLTLYFTSLKPIGEGGADIWRSRLVGDTWTEPENLGPPVNSARDDLQPTFTVEGDTMYFASDRNILIGMAIYRSVRDGTAWGEPELVIQGIVGEPSLTADGTLLYFVHILSDLEGNYDADIWYCERVEK